MLKSGNRFELLLMYSQTKETEPFVRTRKDGNAGDRIINKTVAGKPKGKAE